MQKSTYLCPYCFTEHKRKTLWFRCRNKRCKPRPDKELAAYNGKAPELRQICFPVTRGSRFSKLEQANCPECKEVTSTLVCPLCHNTLPSFGKRNKQVVLSMVGAMDAGKSSYMAVLIRELKRHIALAIHGSASFMDENSAREYEERFLRYLYPWIGTEPSMRIPKTRSCLCGGSFVSVNRPILINCKLNKTYETIFRTRTQTMNYALALYDAAGEDFEDEGVMFTLSNNLIHSNGIFFFIDPMRIPYVRNLLRKEQVDGAATSKLWSSSSADDILLRTAKLLRTKLGIPEQEKLKIPIAVVITKLDVIQDVLPKTSLLRKESRHLKEGGFVRQEGAEIQEEVGALLYEWGEVEFLSHLQADFSNLRLFAVSSFGNNPDPYGRLQHPKPVRVEDPFLWLLSENNVIDLI
ncbi:MAG: hypothetical protein Q4G58_11575 [bacterium]|nr:hypothetical protein [bacterium]